MHARDFMTRPPITCHVNDPLTIAAQRMWNGDVGVVLVVNDEGRLTGVITDRDICMAAFTQGRALDELLVNIAMSKSIVSASPEATIDDIERLMAKNQIRRIPIVDDAGRPVGIVSTNDLVIESVQPRTEMKHRAAIAQTLAAIGAHRRLIRDAA